MTSKMHHSELGSAISDCIFFIVRYVELVLEITELNFQPISTELVYD